MPPTTKEILDRLRETKLSAFSDNALIILGRRYLKKDATGLPAELPEQLFARVARAVAAADALYDPELKEKFERRSFYNITTAIEEDLIDSSPALTATAEEFYKLMTDQLFMPNSPTLMNAGRELGQLSACFVLPVGDSIEEIFEAVKYSALVHKSGGGTGFSFSRLRPKKDIVQSTSGIASGPLSFIEVFDAATEAIKQGGMRRGANMAVLRVDHPDIEEFIAAKADQSKFQNFNFSVALTDDFMAALVEDRDYELINPRTGKVVSRRSAKEIFEQIVEQAWANGEPGVIFIDAINRVNPTAHLGAIESTNPCGEQPLHNYESCNLGSINLAKMVRDKEFCWSMLERTVETAVHFLDNVVDINRYPLPQIEQATLGNRRIGLGVMGWADTLIELGIAYDSEDALKLADKIAAFVQKKAKASSAELARQRGNFPNFKGSSYDRDGEFMRNATVTTIAPTGTISIFAGCSSGIEPLHSLAYERRALEDVELPMLYEPFFERARREGFYSDDLERRVRENRGSIQGFSEIPKDVRRVFKTALDIAPEWHIKMQAAFQKHIDNAVSKTVNFPNSATKEDVKKVYLLAYELGCKGVTVYRDGSREKQPVRLAKPTKPFVRYKKVVIPRGVEEFPSRKYRIETGQGTLHITIVDEPVFYAKRDNPNELWIVPREHFPHRIVGSDIEDTERALSIFSSKYLRGADPDYAEFISVLKSLGARGERSIGFGEGKIPSPLYAIGHVSELHFTRHCLVGRDEQGVLKQIVRKSELIPTNCYINEMLYAVLNGGEAELVRLGRPVELFRERYCPKCGSPNINYRFSEGCMGGYLCADCGASECE